MTIEKPSYDTLEIQQKFETEWYDWEAIKAKLDIIAQREEVDTKLSELSGNTEWYYNYLKELIDTEGKNWVRSKVKEIATSALSSASESIESGMQDTIESAEGWGKNQVKTKLWGLANIPIIWEWLSNFVFDTLKTSYENNKWGIMATILGYFGFDKIMSKSSDVKKGVVSESESDIPVEETHWKSGSIANDTSATNWNIPHQVSHSPEFLLETQDKMRMAGYKSLWKLSGLSQEWFETEIMWALDGQKHTLQSLQFKLYNSSNNEKLSELYWIHPKYTNEQISKVVVGLIGPYNKEFFKYQISPNQIQKLIWDKVNYSETGKKYFTSQELKEISSQKHDYSSLSIWILSRLSILSLGTYISIAKSIPSEFAWKISNVFRDTLSDEELQNIFSGGTKNFPGWVSQIFTDTLSWKADTDTNISFFENIASGKNFELTKQDRVFLENILAFNISMRQELESYSLWVTWFSEDINSNITWQKLLSIYVISWGKTLSSIEWFWKIMVYTWMYESLSPSKQWNYETKILEALANDDNKDSLVLQAVAFQVLEFDRNKFYTLVQKTKGKIDWAVEYIVPWIDNIADPTVRWIAINLLEMGLLTLAIKTLSRTPITKAVLIATSGIIGSLIYLWISEWLHKNTQSEIWKNYKKFIETIAPRIWYDNANTLIDGVNSGKIGVWEVMSQISPEKIAWEELGKIFFDTF